MASPQFKEQIGIVTDIKIVQSLFVATDDDMMISYADNEPELSHVLDFAVTDHNNQFIAGASACCGREDNSRGTNFTILPDALYVEPLRQGEGYGRLLIDTILDKALAHYDFDNPTNEIMVSAAFGSTEGAICCFKFFQALKERVKHLNTKPLFYVVDFGMVASKADLDKAIKDGQFCH